MLVVVAGVAVRAPLSRVPENTLKYAVGVMLTAFGMFWGPRAPVRTGRAATRRSSPDRVHARQLAALRSGAAAAPRPTSAPATRLPPHESLRSLAAFLYDFVVGEDPLIAVAVAAALGMTAAIAAVGVAAWWILPPGSSQCSAFRSAARPGRDVLEDSGIAVRDAAPRDIAFEARGERRLRLLAALALGARIVHLGAAEAST